MQTKFTTAIVRRRGTELTGWHVLLVFVVFFAAVFAVNATMIYSAVSTYSGVVAAEPFRKGLHYNDRILANERQLQLHWLDTLTIDREGRVELSLTNADGHAITGLSVATTIGRPSTNREDVKVDLAAGAAGRYEAQIAPLAPGSWIATIDARTSAQAVEPIFRARRRVWMAP